VDVGNLIPEIPGGYGDDAARPDAEMSAFAEVLPESQASESLPNPFGIPGDGAVYPDQLYGPDTFSSQDSEAMPIGDQLAPEAYIADPDQPLGPTGSSDPGLDPMASSLRPGYAGPDQLQYGTPLEDVVEQELDPYALMDPWGMNPYGMPPGMAMPGMPMDPFGPGPM
jgi:hypothetical protein